LNRNKLCGSGLPRLLRCAMRHLVLSPIQNQKAEVEIRFSPDSELSG
jgi:hypothetical protein